VDITDEEQTYNNIIDDSETIEDELIREQNFNERDLVWFIPFFEFTHILSGHYFAFKHFITRKKI